MADSVSGFNARQLLARPLAITFIIMRKSIIIIIILLIKFFPSYTQESAKAIKLSVEPDTGLYHRPVKIIASGFEPGQKVTIQIQTIDDKNHHWRSHAVFMANNSGTVDPGKSEAIDGTYTGTYSMGLFWSMKSNDYHQIATGKGFTAIINVLLDNEIVANDTVYRSSTRELDILNISLTQKRDSIIADYYVPKGVGKLPAIIFLGGSGGQFRQERSSLLASQGFAVLNLKYFGHEGLPNGIIEIPLEYVEKAFKWLSSKPEIDNSKIGMMGRSMGSELALLYAANYDGLSYVVVEAPSNVVWFGWEDGKSSFSYQGREFPYAEYSEEDSEKIELEMKAKGEQYHDGPKFLSAFKNKAMIEMAAIKVENIKCPVLFISGKDDKVWPSTMMSNMMMKRLKENDFPYDYQHYAYDNAGHNFAGGGQGCGIPYLPPEDYSNSSARGGTDKGNVLAAIQSWNDIFKFIEKHSSK